MSELSDKILILERNLEEEKAIVDRIWKILGSPTFDELHGRSIYDLIEELKVKAQRNVID